MTAQNYLASHGKQLIENGYLVVPIKEGFKYPEGISKWERLKLLPSDLNAYAMSGYTGVGILAHNTPAIDIDIQDAEVTKKILGWCKDQLGIKGIRIGKAPKALIPCRTETPFKKASTATWYNIFGDVASDGSLITHKVEILGVGQQYVAYGRHPETKKDYFWKGQDLLDQRVIDLPLLTQKDIADLFNYVASIIPDDWEELPGKSKQVREATEEDALLNISPRLNISVTELGKALHEVCPDDYDMWIKTGMALHHQFCGGMNGFDIWDEWSQGSQKYNSVGMLQKWRTFSDQDGSFTPVTAASILREGREAKKAKLSGGDVETPDEEETNLDKFLKRFVYVTTGDMVADLDKPPQHCLMRLAEFKNSMLPIQDMVPVGRKGNMKAIAVGTSWMKDPYRKMAHGITYAPSKERVIKDSEGLSWINEFYAPKFNRTREENKLDFFFEHMSYLLPVEKEREWFIKWLAFNVQKPSVRCKVTPLLVSREHGTGRGWVVELMQKQLGNWNVTKTKIRDLASGKFLDPMHRSLLCAVEEVRESDKRYAVNDSIRDLLTETYLEINLKYGAKKTQQIFVNFFFMTNHPDALIIPEEDRRIAVFSGPDRVRKKSYYNALYATLDDQEAMDQLHNYLIHVDLVDFDWMRAMDTEAKRCMILANYSDTEAAFRSWIKETDLRVFSATQLQDVLAVHRGVDLLDADFDETQLRHLVRQHAKPLSSTWVPEIGKSVRLWQLFSAGKLTDTAIRLEFKKTCAYINQKGDL